MYKSMMYKLMIGCLVWLISSNAFAWKSVALEDLHLNRKADKLSGGSLPELSHVGFRWNSGDNGTCQWRPQGIAGIRKAGRSFLAISWYHRDAYKNDGDRCSKGKGSLNKGVRVSFVDVTDRANIRYRHVLLRDRKGKPLSGVHAGGLTYRHGMLHVTGAGRRMYTFDIKDIEEVPKRKRDETFGYRYVLDQDRSYEVSNVGTTSFASYAWTAKRYLTGKFSKTGAGALVLYEYPKRAKEVTGKPLSVSCAKMQGAAILEDRIWLATSYGRGNDSHLYWHRIPLTGRTTCDDESWKKMAFPPGLEDLHVTSKSGNLWLLTEFGTRERTTSKPNDRIVFAIKTSRFR